MEDGMKNNVRIFLFDLFYKYRMSAMLIVVSIMGIFLFSSFLWNYELYAFIQQFELVSVIFFLILIIYLFNLDKLVQALVILVVFILLMDQSLISTEYVVEIFWLIILSHSLWGLKIQRYF